MFSNERQKDMDLNGMGSEEDNGENNKICCMEKNLFFNKKQTNK